MQESIDRLESAGIVNSSLFRNANTENFIERGFIETGDADDPFSLSWEFANDNFKIVIDCTFVVSMCRTETDYIKVIVTDLHDLDCLMDWIADA